MGHWPRPDQGLSPDMQSGLVDWLILFSQTNPRLTLADKNLEGSAGSLAALLHNEVRGKLA